jgi:hypothetical protein
MKRIEVGQTDASKPLAIGDEQLNLFPMPRLTRISCLPMGEIHGAAFKRHLDGQRINVIADVRPYPFFDLVGIDRSTALDAIHRSASRYVHVPLDLRHPRDQLERWKLREQVINTFEQLGATTFQMGARLIVLCNNVSECSTFAEFARAAAFRGIDHTHVEVLR